MIKDKFTKILDKGINAELLKLIAVITMFIDHFGYYFYDFLNPTIYTICRNIGRIAMPIFVYSLVQGFFYTKNFKKYFTRITLVAIITQIIFISLKLLNLNVVAFKNYTTNIYEMGNILFSFSICLILMYIIHNKILVQKWDKNKNLLLKIFIVLGIMSIYAFIPIDYDYTVPILALMFYMLEKFKITIMLNRQSGAFNIQNVFSKSISEEKIKYTYKVLLGVIILFVVIYSRLKIYTLLSIIPIVLYNGMRKQNNSNVTLKTIIHRYGWYMFFPFHHFLLYLTAMILSR